MDQIALTDDEAVAIGILSRENWPSFLPTVNVEDFDDLSAAGRRGLRSLSVRGLAGVTTDASQVSLSAELAAFVAPVVDRALEFTASIIDDGGKLVLDGLMTNEYVGTRGGGLIEVVSPAGVHHLSSAGTKVRRNLAAAIVRDTYESGLTPPTAAELQLARKLLVTGPIGATTMTLIVARGTIRAYHHHSDGTTSDLSDPPDSLDAALDLVLG